MRRATENFNAAQAGQAQAQQEMQTAYADAYEQARIAVSSVKALLETPPQVVNGPKLPLGSDSDIRSSYKTSDPKFVGRAEPIRKRLSQVQPLNPTQQEVRDLGNAAIMAASKSWDDQDISTAETQLSIGTMMADLLVGLDPVTGFVRSGYELATGRNFITGEELATWQRVMAGTIFTTSLVTFGAASSLANAVKAVAGVIREMNPTVARAALEALYGSKYIVDELKAMGWSEQQINKFALFQKNVLGSEIRNFDEALQAFTTWSPEAKAAYRRTVDTLTGDVGKLAAEAKHYGVSGDTLLARKATAVGYYNNVRGFVGNSEKIAKHLKGIDFAEEVAVKRIPKGSKLFAWASPEVAPGLGNYYSESLMHPSKLGTGDLVLGKDGETLYSKALRTYEVRKEALALESTANEIADEFSVSAKTAPFAGFDRYATKNSPPIPGLQWTQGLGKQLLLDPANVRFIQ
ncbi:pre-toxin TG domain-containing protein [Bradyrhizobium sp. 186]|uniref:pre-toxin TG domain-containing protein n=1 Tax=Bradyrhizobium sp. 186 TaxID=2782654 RepID=UPI00200143FD|nr:pre-toxin TG domain-containing protein [Bradyrhizobium sp. 186]UPK39546.1 pre-toxin TG domain-containing protein [Bradyrhizobium sp. 186]